MTRMLLHCFLLALSPLTAAAQPDTEGGQGLATIVTGNADPERCLAAVSIREIDGRTIPARIHTFELAAGLHSMNGRAMLDTRSCPVARSEAYPPVPDLITDFEAGKTYHVGLDHSSANSNDWRLVIWKVEGGESSDGIPHEPGDQR